MSETAKVMVNWQGIDEVIGNLSNIEERAMTNLEDLTKELADDTQTAWKEATPKGKTGRLQGEEEAVSEGLSFSLESPTEYYPFVDEGHWTPFGWRTKRGYHLAKRRSFVKGREMTQAAVGFVEANINRYLSRFLDNA